MKGEKILKIGIVIAIITVIVLIIVILRLLNGNSENNEESIVIDGAAEYDKSVLENINIEYVGLTDELKSKINNFEDFNLEIKEYIHLNGLIDATKATIKEGNIINNNVLEIKLDLNDNKKTELIAKINLATGKTEVSEEEFDFAFDKNVNNSYYFVIKSIIQNYYINVEYVNGNIEIDEARVQNVAEAYNKYKEYGLKTIKDILDEKFINEFSIDNNYIIQALGKYKSIKNPVILINNTAVSYISDTQGLFLVDYNVNNVQDIMLIKVDFDNKLFSIFMKDYLDKYKYSLTMSKNSTNIDDSKLQKNDNNTFSYVTISDETMAREYLNICKNMTLINSQKLFNVLNEEYRNKRFGNYDNFQKYVTDVSEKMKKGILAKYKVQIKEDGDTEYSILDNFNNYYIITAQNNSMLDFKVQLDDYTIKTKEFIEEYNNSSDEKKVSTNISEFISCINTKNYKTAYDRLNDTFKNTNFGSLEKFEAFMKNNLYDNNIIQSAENIEKNGAYYVCKIVIKNGQGQETKNMSIVMQLLENLDYQMSFSF